MNYFHVHCQACVYVQVSVCDGGTANGTLEITAQAKLCKAKDNI